MNGFLRTLVVAAVLAGASSAGSAAAQTPPAGSPAALNQRPRLFFTASQVPEIRQRIASHYQDEFQQLLDQLGSPSKLSSRQREHESDWGSLNAAMVAALGPAELKSLGFNLPSHLDTRQELCGQAMTYARTKLPAIAKATALGHSAFTTGYSYAVYLPVMATYDWCHADLSQPERAEIADAFVAMYNKKYAGKNARTIKINGLERMANNQAAPNIHDILSAVVLWGDSYPDATTQAAMYKTFDTLWHYRLLNELNIFYEHGTHWHEGPGGYFDESLTSLSLGLAAVSPALARPYAAETPLYLGFGRFVHAVTKPNTTASTCGSGNDKCPPYYDRWGTISGGVSGPSCSPMMLVAGMLRMQGQSEPAGLLKWAIDNYYPSGCSGAGKSYGGTFFNGWKWFLFGDKGIDPINPAGTLPRAQKHGLGLYSMRSSYRPDASQVLFFAQPFYTYGHGTPDYGTFTLHKYGNLILQAANDKSGAGAFVGVPSSAPSRGSLFKNVLTLHRGATHPGLGIQTYGKTEPRFADLGIMSSARMAGDVKAESLNAHGFDYVSYDGSPLFLDTTATVSHREFVYIAGAENHEYVVVFDRFNALKPDADEKIWRIWVPNQPEFVDGAGTSPRPGKWTSSIARTISMTNKFGAMSNDSFRGGPTNGRFFMKTLSPVNPVINFLGGDNAEFQSGDDDGSTPWGKPKMNQASREYLGWGRVEVRPSVAANYDTFLNVIQFGAADALTGMSTTLRVRSADGRFLGSHIADASNEWVTMFAEKPADMWTAAQLTYDFSPASGTSKHVVFNLKKGASYHVAPASSGAGTSVTVSQTPMPNSMAVTTNESGVLHFTLTGLTVTPHVVPLSPVNLRLVQ